MLLHVSTDTTPSVFLSLLTLTPPSLSLPRASALLAVDDFLHNGLERPLLAPKGAAWQRTGGVLSYGPVEVPALASPPESGDGASTPNIGVFLQSRAREAAASLKPIEERCGAALF